MIMSHCPKILGRLLPVLLTLLLVANIPCMACPSLAQTDSSSSHDCCPGEKGKESKIPGKSCCVISGYCMAAELRSGQMNIPLFSDIDFSPDFSPNLPLLQLIEMPTAPVVPDRALIPPILFASALKRQIFLQRFLI